MASCASSSSRMILTTSRQVVLRQRALATAQVPRRCISSTPSREFGFGDIVDRIRSVGQSKPEEKKDEDSPEGTAESSEGQKKPKKNDKTERSLSTRLADHARGVMFGRRQEQLQQQQQQPQQGGTGQVAVRRTYGGGRSVYPRQSAASSGNSEFAGVSAEGEDLVSEFDQEALDKRTENLLARIEQRAAKRIERKRWNGEREHKSSTAVFRISPQKLQDLADQINGKPIDHAILQMQFSSKKASRRVRSALCLARDHAIGKGLDRPSMVVSEAWVNKGPNVQKFLVIMGRGRHGIGTHPKASLHFVLREGKSRHAQEMQKLEKARRMVRSIGTGGVARTSRPLTTSGSAWGY